MSSGNKNIVSDFRARACLYARWDQLLSMRTRFFGAAAVTNAALIELFSRIGVSLFVSSFTREFLASVGGVLEHMNMEWARRIAAGSMQAENLDSRMIAAEQAVVQDCLAGLRYTDCAAYASTVVEIDRVLTWARCAGSPAQWLSARTAYATVLQHAADELGRSASFAVQNDREIIGLMLIRHLQGAALTSALPIRSSMRAISGETGAWSALLGAIQNCGALPRLRLR
jgi:hypothetical protein